MQATAAIAAIIVGASGCSSSAHRAAPTVTMCAALRLADSSHPTASGPVPLVEAGTLPWLALAFDRDHPQVIIYLDPGRSGDLGALRGEVAHHSGVASTTVMDEQATYADFQHIFRDQPAMLAHVHRQDLPTSVRVEVSDVDAAAALTRWAKVRPGVFEVRSPSDVAPIAVADMFVSDRDRRTWTQIAEDLDRIDKEPAWASSLASLIRSILRDGVTVASQKATGTMHAARLGLTEAEKNCG